MAYRTGTTYDLARYMTTSFWHESGAGPFDHNDSGGNVITVNISGIAPQYRDMARVAMEAWEAVADIEFREVSSGGTILFRDDAGQGAYTIGSGGGSTVHISSDWIDEYTQQPGGYGQQVFIHELGHALGLGHPGLYPGGATYGSAVWTNDSWQQTIMSYLDQDENPTVRADKAYLLTPMMADIVAIQWLYGAPSGGVTAGSTTYGVGSDLGTYLDAAFRGNVGSLTEDAMTIYDEGGHDRINFSNDTQDQVVHLEGGRFLSVYGQLDNVGIAYRTVIEDFLAGRGNDRVTGNRADNFLDLGSGADKGSGGYGDDRIRGEGGRDELHGGNHRDKLMGGDADDKLFGGEGSDELAGNDGSDVLDGGEGNDLLSGGAGRDRFVFTNGFDAIAAFADDADTLVLHEGLWGGGWRSLSWILDQAEVRDGDAVFRFGNDDRLVIRGVTDLRSLQDDLVVA